jgi:HSP20 family protein
MARRPADPFFALRRLDSMLNDAFGGWANGESGAVTSAWLPAVDVMEDKEGVRLTAELPGVRQEDVKISLENGILTIRGEKKSQVEEKSDRVHRVERQYGSFERSFALPTTVDVERIEARFDAGVLTVTLPKAEKAKPRQIEIKAQA